MLLGEPIVDRRTRRHEATKHEIVDAAWEVAREKGVAALALSDVAARVGMRVPSLYSYFASKNDIYDAMFAQGSDEFVAFMGGRLAELPGGLRERVRGGLQIYFDFCTEDPTRYQLLFQRTIPNFVPSAASYGKAVEALRIFREDLAGHGLDVDPADQDLLTALGAGVVEQQIANDPGGDRWRPLVDVVADMAFDYLVHKHGINTRASSAARTRSRR